MTDDEFETEARKRMKAKGATKIEVFTGHIERGQRTIGAGCTFRGQRMEVSFIRGSHDENSKKHILHAIEGLGAK